METNFFLLAFALGTSTCLLTAQSGLQNGNPPLDGQRPPPREGGAGDQRGGNGSGGAEILTEAQKTQVRTILAKYAAATLTADQAKAIHEAFREAGLRGGPAMADAIKSAGFDPDKLRDLAPPPGQPSGENEPHPHVDGNSTPSGGGLNGVGVGGTQSAAASR